MTATIAPVVGTDLAGLYDAIVKHVGGAVALNWIGHRYTGPLHAASLYTIGAPQCHHIRLNLTTGLWSVYIGEAKWFAVGETPVTCTLYLVDPVESDGTLLPDAHWDAILATGGVE